MKRGFLSLAAAVLAVGMMAGATAAAVPMAPTIDSLAVAAVDHIAAPPGNVCSLQVVEDFAACSISIVAVGGRCSIGIATAIRDAGVPAIGSAAFAAACPATLLSPD